MDQGLALRGEPEGVEPGQRGGVEAGGFLPVFSRGHIIAEGGFPGADLGDAGRGRRGGGGTPVGQRGMGQAGEDQAAGRLFRRLTTAQP